MMAVSASHINRVFSAVAEAHRDALSSTRAEFMHRQAPGNLQVLSESLKQQGIRHRPGQRCVSFPRANQDNLEFNFHTFQSRNQASCSGRRRCKLQCARLGSHSSLFKLMPARQTGMESGSSCSEAWASKGRSSWHSTIRSCQCVVRATASWQGERFTEEGCHDQPLPEKEMLLSCTTFNILAPIYKRMQEDKRESELREAWLERNNEIADVLSRCGSSIICLQEFWLDNLELVNLYQEKLGPKGYELHTLARTNNRGDGLLTAVKRDRLEVVDYQKLPFNDCGDRVAQVLRLRSRQQGNARKEGSESNMEMLVVNTHLLFPHNSNSSLIRLREVYKILEYLEDYKRRTRLPRMPILLCGDWNGSKRGQVYKFLRSQGFVSSYDMARQYSDSDHYKWVSHRNHHGIICGVDYIWLLNPSEQEQPLDADWKAAVFGMIKAKLTDAGLQEQEAFRFFQTSDSQEEDYVTLQGFQYAMDQLGLTGHNTLGLTPEEIAELVQSADVDGNGVIDYSEFQRLFSGASMEETYARIRAATGIVESPWMPDRGSIVAESDPGLAPQTMAMTSLGLEASSPQATGRTPSGGTASMAASVCLQEVAIAGTTGTEEGDVIEDRVVVPDLTEQGVVNFAVKDAFLFPPEVEEGQWPEHYSMSDHAPLTAVFTLLLA